MTVIEAQIAALILFVLTGALFWIYSSCTAVFVKADVHLDLLAAAQTVSERLNREVERGSFDSAIDIDEGLGFLSAIATDGSGFTMQPTDIGSLEWAKYDIFRFNSADGRVEYREVPLQLSDPQRRVPTKIGLWNGPDGFQPLDYYVYTDPGAQFSTLARNVYACTFDVNTEYRCVNVTMGLRKARYRRTTPDYFVLRSTAAFRNPSPVLP